MAVAIAFSSVSKTYPGGKAALDSISFSIQDGSHTCLLGPNGAGKSTAIRLLQGAISPTSGAVYLWREQAGFDGYDDARRRVGSVPQSPGMYADLEAGEYLGYVRRLYGRGEIAAVVDRFGLAAELKTRMSALSGGFQRRLLLAAALLPEPDILLLDEPTAGLDPIAAREVHEYLADVVPGRTILLCTHNLPEAERLCDDVVILDAGRVIVHRPIADLRRGTRPRLRLAVAQGAQALRQALVARGLSCEADGEAQVIECDDPRGLAPGLVRELLASGLDVYECSPLEASLEAMFLDALAR